MGGPASTSSATTTPSTRLPTLDSLDTDALVSRVLHTRTKHCQRGEWIVTPGFPTVLLSHDTVVRFRAIVHVQPGRDHVCLYATLRHCWMSFMTSVAVLDSGRNAVDVAVPVPGGLVAGSALRLVLHTASS